jgi:hypothetical protein
MGREAADLVVHLARRLRPVDAGFSRLDLGGIGNPLVVLRPAGQGALLKVVKRPHHELRAEFGEAIVQLPGRLVGTDRGTLHKADGAHVELLLDAHDRNAGLGVAGQKCTLDRRGTPPAWQKRGMNVEAAIMRRIEDRVRQDLPVGHHHASVGVERLEARLLYSASEACRRVHGESLAFGEDVHRRFAGGKAPACGARRLGVDACDLVAGSKHRAKRRHGKIRRPHEDDAHWGHSHYVIAGLDPAIHSIGASIDEMQRHGCPDQVRA